MVTAKDENGWTPLHYVVGYDGGQDLVHLLVEHGADATAKDKCGQTPLHNLHLAVQTGREDLARSLIQHGADANAEDKSGWSPLRLVILLKREDLVRACSLSMVRR